jgi:hypothetical protein
VRLLVQLKPSDRVIEYVRYSGEYRPPIPRRSAAGARRYDRIAIIEQHLEKWLSLGVDIFSGDLTYAWHGRDLYRLRVGAIGLVNIL